MQDIETMLTTWAAAHLSFIAGTAGAPPIPGTGTGPAREGGPR